MSRVTMKGVGALLKDAGHGFIKDKVPKLSASLAYYTIFSLGPMLMVIIFLANLFYGRDAIEGRLFGQIRQLVGDKAALQIQEIISNASITGSACTATIGFVVLIVAATSVFTEIQDSINSIWKLSVKADRGWYKMLRTRVQSFSLVIGLGFLMMVSLIINGVAEGLMDRLQQIFPTITVIVAYVINLAITLVLISFLFAIIFRVLPDAIIHWKDVSMGAIFTAILFMIGKFCITLYIRKSNIGSAYGTAGSLVILLLWVYYSAIILYFGAEFTKCYAIRYGSEIVPNQYAVTVQMMKVETGKRSIQENEKDTKKKEDAETMKEAENRQMENKEQEHGT